MKSDDIEQLKELIAFLKENGISEFDLDRGDLKVRLKFASAETAASGVDLASLARMMAASQGATPVSGGTVPSVITIPAAAHANGAAEPAAAAAPEEALHIVKSPMVGTFYESPSPGASAFVATGSRIEKGQIVCIVEAMKLMNEIESDAAGEIVKRLVTNGQAVEFGQPLFAIRTS